LAFTLSQDIRLAEEINLLQNSPEGKNNCNCTYTGMDSNIAVMPWGKDTEILQIDL